MSVTSFLLPVSLGGPGTRQSRELEPVIRPVAALAGRHRPPHTAPTRSSSSPLNTTPSPATKPRTDQTDVIRRSHHRTMRKKRCLRAAYQTHRDPTYPIAAEARVHGAPDPLIDGGGRVERRSVPTVHT